MDASAVLSICQQLILDAGQVDRQVGVNKSFLDYAQLTMDILKDWPKDRIEKATPWLHPFILQLKRMRDDFAKMVEQDPPILYKPINKMAIGFHKSLARYRYAHSGNRCSKTQMGCQEDYWYLTGAHPWRPLPPQPTSVVIIGTDYSSYGPQTFEPKWVYGETGTIISPMFPEDGKWFHSYNKIQKTLKLGCKDCAEKGKAKMCPHPKPLLHLISDKGSPQAIAGSQHGLIHEDEQVEEEHHQEAEKRIESVPNGSLIATETPVRGRAHWTYEKYVLASKLEDNQFFNPATQKWVPNITTHTCSQYEGNIVPHEVIDSWKKGKSRELIDLRVYGKHVAVGAHHVFDLSEINAKMDFAKTPWRGDIRFKGELPHTIRDTLRELDDSQKHELKFKKHAEGMFYIWKGPKREEQYIVTCDVAQGLSNKDNSVAHVYRLFPRGTVLYMEHVAKIRGWINPSPYAHMVHKLALVYNRAPVIVERNGPGHSVLYELVEETGYDNVYQAPQNIDAVERKEDAIYGLNTTGESKPVIISMAQNMLKDRKTNKSRLVTWDKQFLGELESYVQTESASGRSLIYEGEGKARDDEVIAFALASFVVKTDQNVYDWEVEEEEIDKYAHLSDSDRQFWETLHEELRRGPSDPKTMVDP